MKNNKLLRVGLLLLVIVAFVYYFLNNSSQFNRIANLNVWQILLIIIGQSMVIISNIFILILFVRFVKKRISFFDSARITAYSSLINFFGFLQGGVGLRGLYLKRHFDISLKRYFALTLSQYLILFTISGLFLMIGITMTSGAYQALLIILLGIILFGVIVFILQTKKIAFYLNFLENLRKISVVFTIWPLLGLIAATLFQLSGSLLANTVELIAIGANITPGGILIYTGVSQFSVVVALTPGGIGIREGFLLIVQNQMHLSAQDIILASTIDRMVYFVTLAMFTPLALSAKNKIPEINR